MTVPDARNGPEPPAETACATCWPPCLNCSQIGGQLYKPCAACAAKIAAASMCSSCRSDLASPVAAGREQAVAMAKALVALPHTHGKDDGLCQICGKQWHALFSEHEKDCPFPAALAAAHAILSGPREGTEPRCESGLPDCGAVAGYSLDEVRLCERCGTELSAEQTRCDDPCAPGAGNIGVCGGLPVRTPKERNDGE